MGRRGLRHQIWGYTVCLCTIKMTPGLNDLISIFLFQNVLEPWGNKRTNGPVAHLRYFLIASLKASADYNPYTSVWTQELINRITKDIGIFHRFPAQS